MQSGSVDPVDPECAVRSRHVETHEIVFRPDVRYPVFKERAVAVSEGGNRLDYAHCMRLSTPDAPFGAFYFPRKSAPTLASEPLDAAPPHAVFPDSCGGPFATSVETDRRARRLLDITCDVEAQELRCVMQRWPE